MIKVEHLTKYYGDFLAVDDLSFEIDEGHVYGFLGPTLYMNETPTEYLRFVGEAKGLRGDELNAQIEDVIRQVRIESVRDRRISSLSKGFLSAKRSHRRERAGLHR